ncbi:hypothetical protein BJX99DRAFT_151841 [Aspergillus californicus]
MPPPHPPPHLQLEPESNSNNNRIFPNTFSIAPTINHKYDNIRRTDSITGSISIPSTYGRQDSSPSPGVVAGATLGAVAGFLLLLYLLYLSLTSGRRFSASTIGSRSATTPSEIVDVGIRPRRGGPGSRSRSRRGGPSAIVVEEEGSYTDRTHTDEGGLVEVIEEESEIDPPPTSSRSSSRTRSDRYRRGGVRGIDPSAYGGESEFSRGS